ncbi:MAG: T9SS type A sorting domain-containing protein, partial [Bacteroidota bacterium]|nr:T9SS type A sorting domain-containing protein [Bacteroidota bacterium]
KVDLLFNNKYTFKLNQNRKFKVVYGSESYVNEQILSSKIALGNAFPNPFTDKITIPFEIPASYVNVLVQLQVFDIAGKLVTSLQAKEHTHGFRKIMWDGLDQSGKRCHSGVYIFKINIVGENINQDLNGRMILN